MQQLGAKREGGAALQQRAFSSRPKACASRIVRSAAPARALGVQVSAVAAAPRPTQQAQRPDASGRYGKFGGKYVPETLIPALAELEEQYRKAMADPAFLVSADVPHGSLHRAQFPVRFQRADTACSRTQAEYNAILKDYVGRATPLYYAERLSKRYAK